MKTGHEGAVETPDRTEPVTETSSHDEARAESEGMIGGANATPGPVPMGQAFGNKASDRPVRPAQLTKTERELAELDEIYTYHAPHGDQTDRYQYLRTMAKMLAQAILTNCPPSRERSLALTSVQQACQMANAAIAIHEPKPAVPEGLQNGAGVGIQISSRPDTVDSQRRDLLYYGPHACEDCYPELRGTVSPQVLICKVARDQGSLIFDYPDGPIYPNTVWVPHVHRTSSESPTGK